MAVRSSVRVAPIDALLLLMAIIWGTNYSIVKHAFREIDPHAYNAVRMTIASAMFLVLIVALQRRPDLAGGRDDAESIASIFRTPAVMTRRDWFGLAGLGVVGHFLYQYFFIGGLARTSVANSSLMLAATPVVIALVTAMQGKERISRLHWLGAALSVAGIYAVVGGGMRIGGSSARGDLMMFAAVCCWAAYTLGARELMTRHSPVGVTGLSMAIGTAIYVAVSFGHVRAVRWTSVSGATWLAILYSAVFALCISYTIWYAAVRAIGSSRTAVYSNLVPIGAMLTAVLFLGEPLGARKVAGAMAVLAGVALTRVGRPTLVCPPQE